MTEPTPLRIGNADREAAAALLRRAGDEGRLTAPEVAERVASADVARTQADLDVLLADLVIPAPTTGQAASIVPAFSAVPAVRPGPPMPPGLRLDDPLQLTAVMTRAKRGGSWELPPFVRAHALLDTVRLDCLTAAAREPLIDLEVLPGAGTVLLVLPDGWAVNVDRLSKGLGSVKVSVPTAPAWGHPLIVVRGSVGMGTFKARGANWFERRRLRRDR